MIAFKDKFGLQNTMVSLEDKIPEFGNMFMDYLETVFNEPSDYNRSVHQMFYPNSKYDERLYFRASKFKSIWEGFLSTLDDTYNMASIKNEVMELVFEQGASFTAKVTSGGKPERVYIMKARTNQVEDIDAFEGVVADPSKVVNFRRSKEETNEDEFDAKERKQVTKVSTESKLFKKLRRESPQDKMKRLTDKAKDWK